MRYFTRELIRDFHDLWDYRHPERAGTLWQKAVNDYLIGYQKTVEPFLSERFKKKYHRFEGFHDCEIKSLQYNFEKRNMMISLSGDKGNCSLSYRGVKKASIEYETKLSGSMPLFWLYDELSLLEEGAVQHNILCFDIKTLTYPEIIIAFDRLAIL